MFRVKHPVTLKPQDPMLQPRSWSLPAALEEPGSLHRWILQKDLSLPTVASHGC